MGNLILYYVKCEYAGLLKINGNIAGSTEQPLCALSPKSADVFLEWQPFYSSELPLCVHLRFDEGSLTKEPLPDTARVCIYSGKLFEVLLYPKKNRLCVLPPHGFFDLPYKRHGEDFALRAYFDGGNIISVERVLDLKLLYLAYTEADLETAEYGVFENGDETLIYVTDKKKTVLLSHSDGARLIGTYNGSVKREDGALVIKEKLASFPGRQRIITFSGGGAGTSFSPAVFSALKTPEELAMALVFCVKYRLTGDAARLLSPDLPRGTAERLQEFFGEFDSFRLPAISARSEHDTVCVALLRDMCENVSMARPFFFKINNGAISNISD